MKLYIHYASIQLRCAMEYKKSFFLTILGQFFTAFSAFLSVLFMMNRFHKIEGFTLPEVFICFAIILMAFSLAETFARGFDTFGRVLGNGEFDRILVRPRSEIFQVLAMKIEFTRVGRLIQAAAVLCYAVPASGIAWNGPKVLTMIFMILGGTALFSSLFLLYAALCFFSTEGLEFMNVFTDGGKEYGKYPVVIYGKGILRFLTFVVPLACVQYYPLTYLMGTAKHGWYALLPCAGFLFLLPCYLVWRIGVRHFKSTGS